MENDQNERRPEWKTMKIEDDQNGRQTKLNTTHGRQQKWMMTKTD